MAQLVKCLLRKHEDLSLDLHVGKKDAGHRDTQLLPQHRGGGDRRTPDSLASQSSQWPRLDEGLSKSKLRQRPTGKDTDFWSPNICVHKLPCIYVYTWICTHVTLDTENRQRIFQVDYDDQRSHQQLLFFLKSPHLVLSVFSVLFMLVTSAAVLLWSNLVLSWWLMVNASLPLEWLILLNPTEATVSHAIVFIHGRGFFVLFLSGTQSKACLRPLVYLFRPPRVSFE